MGTELVRTLLEMPRMERRDSADGIWLARYEAAYPRPEVVFGPQELDA